MNLMRIFLSQHFICFALVLAGWLQDHSFAKRIC
jgi:hypothetical protein